jgi:hypothetical protein
VGTNSWHAVDDADVSVVRRRSTTYAASATAGAAATAHDAKKRAKCAPNDGAGQGDCRTPLLLLMSPASAFLNVPGNLAAAGGAIPKAVFVLRPCASARASVQGRPKCSEKRSSLASAQPDGPSRRNWPCRSRTWLEPCGGTRGAGLADCIACGRRVWAGDACGESPLLSGFVPCRVCRRLVV